MKMTEKLRKTELYEVIGKILFITHSTHLEKRIFSCTFAS